jgi:hypothetical protein
MTVAHEIVSIPAVNVIGYTPVVEGEIARR